MRRLLLLFFFLLATASSSAQRPDVAWTRLLERREGWLGADGIYSIDLNRDARTNKEACDAPPRRLFVFSDTIVGTTKNDGREYDRVFMTNHSFAILNANSPDPEKIKMIWSKPEKNGSIADAPQNIVDGRRWLQDGIRYGNRVVLSTLLVGENWKPERVEALSFPIDPQTAEPDFSQPSLKTDLPLSRRRDDAQIVLGAAICDDADDGFLYIFGYVDHFREFSRKDAVVARVPRDALEQRDKWSFYDGAQWRREIETLFEPSAAIVRGVSTEFSVSKLDRGEGRGKWLFVYTPGVISDECAFRLGEAPQGPYGKERVFWRSTIPREIEGVSCYNAKAHPVFNNDDGVLVSYNVNRLGEIARRPEEYRPRFVRLEWATIGKAAKEDAESFGR